MENELLIPQIDKKCKEEQENSLKASFDLIKAQNTTLLQEHKIWIQMMHEGILEDDRTDSSSEES